MHSEVFGALQTELGAAASQMAHSKQRVVAQFFREAKKNPPGKADLIFEATVNCGFKTAERAILKAIGAWCYTLRRSGH